MQLKLTICLFITCLLGLQTLNGQIARGLGMPADEKATPHGKTYALIIGISKYKNEGIPQLQFADKDAIAFKNYLLATGVDSNNITLLTNEGARYADIMSDLDELCTDKAMAGDRVFIYFSGHGDVESHVITNIGYLLPYDAPKKVYCISAINVRTLQDYVSTLSAKGVQAIVITDACHSGNLAGGLEGLKNIQTVLGDKWSDEIKILSCQPGELSLEGKSWGNGRGLFSFELINGLAGLADKNKDGNISLNELSLYLGAKVPEEASPAPQYPVITGNMPSIIGRVNNIFLAQLNSNNSMAELTTVDLKGFDEALIKNLHDTVRTNYQLFKLYIDSGIIVRRSQFTNSNNPLVRCAFYYYQRIPQNEKTALLISLMKKNLAVVSLKYADELLSHSLSDSSIGIPYIDDLIVNAIHLGYTDAKLRDMGYLSKFYFLESMESPSQDSPNRYLTGDSLSKYLKLAIKEDTTSTYLYCVAGLFNIDSVNTDNYYKRAILLSPSFGFSYSHLGEIYVQQHKYDSALYCYRTLYSLLKSNGGNFHRSALTGIATVYYHTDKKYLGDSLLNVSIQLLKEQYGNGTVAYYDGIHSLAFKLQNSEVYDKALELFEDYVKNTPTRDTFNDPYFFLRNIVICNAKLGRKSDGLEEFSKFVKSTKRQVSSETYYNIACYYSMLNNKPDALKYLENALKAGWSGFEDLEEENELINISHEPLYKALVKKYFHDKPKN